MKTIKGINFDTAVDKEYSDYSYFLVPIIKLLYQALDDSNQSFMQLDSEHFRQPITELWYSFDSQQKTQVRKLANPPSAKNIFEANLLQKILICFCSVYPEYALQLKNLHFNADVSIRTAEKLEGKSVSANNFVKIKRAIDELNKKAWSRPQTPSEQQSGVSNLGTISEKLLEMAFQNKIDATNFFKTSNQDIQSYGDFVLMCLPNNLWISVKSNYARERLLASGYTTDIIGVGFFTDMKEFTSRSKLRNFQRVGFLALYLPNIPITEEQVNKGVSTFEQVEQYYAQNQQQMPLNINGKPFLRPLSELGCDLDSLLDEKDIKKRTTIYY